MNKILITTSSFNLETPEILALQDAGFEVILNPYGRRLSETEVKELLTSDVVGMIAGVEPLTRDVIENTQNLRAISRCGIGLDSVDLKSAEEKGIIVSNTPDAPTKAVAELTLALMLNCLRGVSLQDRAIREDKWKRPMGGLLGARTIGLIGFGRIGKKVAEYASGFGAKVIAYDTFLQESPFDEIPLVTMEELLSQADIVSLHIPYSKDVHHIMDESNLSKMKEGAILINTSRGGLVDETALADALQNGRLSSAALDVYEEEPYKGSLTNIDNVTLTAHVGSYAKESRIEQESLAAKNLLEALSMNEKKRANNA